MKKEYISPKSQEVKIEPETLLVGSLQDGEVETEEMDIFIDDFLDPKDPGFKIW